MIETAGELVVRGVKDPDEEAAGDDDEEWEEEREDW